MIKQNNKIARMVAGLLMIFVANNLFSLGPVFDGFKVLAKNVRVYATSADYDQQTGKWSCSDYGSVSNNGSEYVRLGAEMTPWQGMCFTVSMGVGTTKKYLIYGDENRDYDVLYSKIRGKQIGGGRENTLCRTTSAMNMFAVIVHPDGEIEGVSVSDPRVSER
jgi:hypothetical protein